MVIHLLMVLTYANLNKKIGYKCSPIMFRQCFEYTKYTNIHIQKTGL